MENENKNELRQNDSKSETESFDSLRLSKKLLHGIWSFGFGNPSEIQKLAIQAIVHDKNDVIVEAMDGMGKTSAFCISALQMVDVHQKQCQIVIISPTKALLSHIKYHLIKLGDKMEVTCEIITASVLKGTSTNNASQIKPKNMNDYDDQSDARKQYQVGSKCQIYLVDKWWDGSVVKIVNNDEGEWLYIRYGLNNNIKPVQRLSTIIRPYRYIGDTQIIVATPAAFNQMISQKILTLETLKFIVIDQVNNYYVNQYGQQFEQYVLELNDKYQNQSNEVDEKKGDISKPQSIKKRMFQIALFTSEITDEILQFYQLILVNAMRISHKPDNPFLNIDHIDKFVEEKWKFIELTELDLGLHITIIFCNDKATVISLTNKLSCKDDPVECIHGDMSDDEIFDKLGRFRNCKIRHLVTTDSFAKGIDVQQIGMVINYDIPSRDNYIYRATRGGLFGRKCKTITFIDPNQAEQYRKLIDIRTIRTPNYHEQRRILFADNYILCKDAIGQLLSNNVTVVGFDCEQGQNGEICLIQIADDKLVIFIRINLLDAFPQNLFDLLANINIIKCGVGIKNDISKMKSQLWDMQVNGIVELNDLYHKGDYQWMISLKDMAMSVLGNKMQWKNRKPGKWTNNILSFNQIHYAADDAVVAYKIFQRLSNNKN